MKEERMIILKCDCGEQYNVKRVVDDDVEHLECNWCPLCVKKGTDYIETKIYKLKD